jgi:GNAT superfamily N-acetyltransferase
VGREYEWQDRFEQAEKDPAALQAFVRDPEVVIWTAIRGGWPAGFFMLDWRQAGVCDLAYFGLVPQAVGTGLGRPLLQTAIAMGWERASVEKMTVNTCTLDHSQALPLYQKMGFKPVEREERTRVLVYDREV